MKNEHTPVCCRCSFMEMIGRARHTGNNLGMKGPRGECHCKHPKAIETFKKVCPRSPRAPGFIGFTAPGEDVPQVKTSPRWCPLRDGR